MEAALRQIVLMGPLNTARLCRSTCTFYRMKDLCEKALRNGLLEEAHAYEQKNAVALGRMEVAAGKICQKVAGHLMKAGEQKAAEGIYGAGKKITEKLATLEENSRPYFGIEKFLGCATLAVSVAGLASMAEGLLKGAFIGIIVTAVMFWKGFAEFAWEAVRLLEKELQKTDGAAPGGKF